MPLKEDMIRIEKGEESEDPFGDDDDDDWQKQGWLKE